MHDSEFHEMIRESVRQHRKPTDMSRELVGRMNDEHDYGVRVVACICEALDDVSLADVKVIGAWHWYGEAKMTDEELDARLAPVFAKSRWARKNGSALNDEMTSLMATLPIDHEASRNAVPARDVRPSGCNRPE
jgi:hypothetical protein